MTIGNEGGFRFAVSGQLELDVVFDGKDYFKQGKDGFELLAVQDLMQQPQTLFAIGLAAMVADKPFGNLPSSVIDGGDKALGRNAWRMAFDGGQDPFFGWFRMYGEAGLPDPQLVKLASDRDASKGGVVFDQWEQKQNRWLPVQGRVVSGLAETTLLTIQVTSVKPASEDDVGFSKLTETEVGSQTPRQKDTEAKQ